MKKSSISKTFYILLGAVLVSLIGFSTKNNWLFVANIITVGAAIYYCLKAKKVLIEIGRIGKAAACGDFEARVLNQAESEELQAAIDGLNGVIDIADAYVRESKATLTAASEDRFYRRIITTGMPGTFKQAAEILNNGMDSIRNNMRAMMQKSAMKLESSVKRTAADLGHSTNLIKKTSSDLSAIAAEVNNQAAMLSKFSSETSDSVNTVASASEELSASISEISEQTLKSNQISSSAVEKAKHAEEVLKTLISNAEKIGTISNMINEIAEKVNLLALNATIESARAGEHGKGFAVVAQEVKNLAIQTSNATTEISAQIYQTQQDINKTSDVIVDIGKTILVLNQVSASVASAVEEQGAATKEISESIARVASTSSKLSESVKDVYEASNRTGSAANNMSKSSDELSAQLNAEIDKFIKEVMEQ